MVSDLEFTGERFMPEVKGNIFLEHMHRYLLASNFVTGKVVLDIACGEGFGSNILAGTASSVIGVDIAQDAIIHARAKYGSDKLSFLTGSVTKIPLEDASVDVVVSFETIEHIDAHAEMMREVRRVLRPNGIFIASTPDKAIYTDATGLKNPYHVKELYRHEFEALLLEHFKHLRMHGQKIGFGSVIAPTTGSAAFHEIAAENLTKTAGITKPMYLIAVASDDPESLIGLNGLFAQDIQGSEPVLKRVAFEQNIWTDAIFEDFEWISNEINALQKSNLLTKAPLGKLLHRIVMSRLLYKLSTVTKFSEKRRQKFLKSAKKRDPLLLGSQLETFSMEYLTRISQNKFFAENASRKILQLGIRVTAIVPNYNHAAFLRQRLDSIIAQTYPLIDIIVLDDCSTDDSRQVIDSYVARFPTRIKAVYNDVNSGSVFSQWKKGHALAEGDLIWICESDDFCEANFVERMIPAFRDPSVMLGFGRIEFVDETGSYMPGLETYREAAEPGIWEKSSVRPALQWFNGGFGVKNVIANVGGSLWRRTPIDDATWKAASEFRIMGDWFLYAHLAQGGQIAYEPSALAYFRSHTGNTSGLKAQSKPEYYQEYRRLMTYLKRRWPLSEETINRFVASCESVYQTADITDPPFADLLQVEHFQNITTDTLHVMIGILGFSFGGGELFPIHLANALRKQGVMVSMLQMMDSEDHPDVRAMLDPSVPVYQASMVRELGGADFIAKLGVSIIHSHLASVEIMLLQELKVPTPYVATLHGSYEAMGVDAQYISGWADRVDQYVYTAERNLTPFKGLNIAPEKFIKFSNAMPIDDRAYSKTRAQLGIPEDAVVFAFVARGVEGKGWLEAVRAFKLLREKRPDQSIALIAVGEGKYTDAARILAAGDPDIHFLGFVKTIHGIYRMSDVALIPTRFSGESYPLCLIQAMQSGVPAIATDIGDIKSMLTRNDANAGILVPNISDDDDYVAALTQSMETILDTQVRSAFAADAAKVSQKYNIDTLASQYLELYRGVISRNAEVIENGAERTEA